MRDKKETEEEKIQRLLKEAEMACEYIYGVINILKKDYEFIRKHQFGKTKKESV